MHNYRDQSYICLKKFTIIHAQILIIFEIKWGRKSVPQARTNPPLKKSVYCIEEECFCHKIRCLRKMVVAKWKIREWSSVARRQWEILSSGESVEEDDVNQLYEFEKDNVKRWFVGGGIRGLGENRGSQKVGFIWFLCIFN